MKKTMSLLLSTLLVLLFACPVAAEDVGEDYVPFRGNGFEIMVPAEWEMDEPPYDRYMQAFGANGNGMMVWVENRHITELLNEYLEEAETVPGWTVLDLEVGAMGNEHRGYGIYRLQLRATGEAYQEFLEAYSPDPQQLDRDSLYMIVYLFELEDSTLRIDFYQASTGPVAELHNYIIGTLRFSPEFTAQR